MKIKNGFVLRQVANLWVVMPFGAQLLDFNGMIKLNDCGAMLWKELEQGSDREGLTQALTREYRVSREDAWQDAGEFLDKLAQAGCLEP